MKPLIYIFAILMMAACAPAAHPTPSPDVPVSSENTPGAEAPPAPYLPQAQDATLQRGPVFLDSADLLVMESFPPQFLLSLAGSLPTPCHMLRVNVVQPDAENAIAVEVYSVVDPNVTCIQVLQSFSQGINLGSFPAGRYRVQINAEKTLEFDAP